MVPKYPITSQPGVASGKTRIELKPRPVLRTPAEERPQHHRDGIMEMKVIMSIFWGVGLLAIYMVGCYLIWMK